MSSNIDFVRSVSPHMAARQARVEQAADRIIELGLEGAKGRVIGKNDRVCVDLSPNDLAPFNDVLADAFALVPDRLFADVRRPAGAKPVELVGAVQKYKCDFDQGGVSFRLRADSIPVIDFTENK